MSNQPRELKKNIDSNSFDPEILLKITRKLIEVLQKENDLLDQPSIGDYDQLCKEKISLVEKYIALEQIIKSNKFCLDSISDDVKKRFKKLQQKLAPLLEANKHKLHTSVKANQMLVGQVKRYVINDIKMQLGYQCNGEYCVNKLTKKMPSISFSEAY